MPQIGPMEIGIVLVVALLFFGPSKLPAMARSAGKGMRELKEGLSGAGENVVSEVRAEDSEGEHDEATVLDGEVVGARA